MTFIRLIKNTDDREVWVSGSEIVRHTDELLDGNKSNERATGRTSKLACKYAELALQYPNCRVVIKDHSGVSGADYKLVKKVCEILDVLNIEWEVGQIDQVVPDQGSFTDTKLIGSFTFIKAKPNIPE